MERRSMLFVPGNNPGMIQNASVFGADSIILDLEDAVSVSEKDAARHLVSEALEIFDFQSECVVRINPFDTDWALEDLEFIVKKGLDTILIPKCDVSSLMTCDQYLSKLEYERGLDRKIQIIALIETAIGLESASEMLKVSDRIVGVLLGGEDLSADLGVSRTRSGDEIMYARMKLVSLCKAHKLQMIDTPCVEVLDEAVLREDLKRGLSLGITGKAAINPRQIHVIHEMMKPSDDDVIWARKVLDKNEEMKSKGIGVFSVNGKMVDAPVIKRAEMILGRLK